MKILRIAVARECRVLTQIACNLIFESNEKKITRLKEGEKNANRQTTTVSFHYLRTLRMHNSATSPFFSFFLFES